MVYKLLFRTIATLVCFALLKPYSVAAASPKDDISNMLAPVKKNALAKGNALLSLLRSHKKYCWDGGDPDAAELTNYESLKSGIALLEKTYKFEQTARGIPMPLDDYAKFRLALADAALSSNCLNIADEQYRAVLREFTDFSYATYRELAKVGIDDVREKRAAQALIDQKHSTPSLIPWELVGDWLPQSSDLIPKDIGKCRPTSPNDSGPFVLKTDGSWDQLFPNAASSHCVLSIAPFSGGRIWKVASTCQPQVTEVWFQHGSARDSITTHEFIDNTATGGKKSVGSTKVEYRRCD
jgi:hypothetical protein